MGALYNRQHEVSRKSSGQKQKAKQREEKKSVILGAAESKSKEGRSEFKKMRKQG